MCLCPPKFSRPSSERGRDVVQEQQWGLYRSRDRLRGILVYSLLSWVEISVRRPLFAGPDMKWCNNKRRAFPIPSQIYFPILGPRKKGERGPRIWKFKVYEVRLPSLTRQCPLPIILHLYLPASTFFDLLRPSSSFTNKQHEESSTPQFPIITYSLLYTSRSRLSFLIIV